MLQNQNNNNKFLDYLTIIKFAVENIYQIKNVAEINSSFQNLIEDITKDRDELRMVELLSMNIPGHEIYFYKFNENANLFGEINVDFIPTNPEEFVRSGIRNLGGFSTIPLYNQKQLVNFRVQLFSDGLSSFLKLKWKNKIVVDYIIKQFGKPNESLIAKEHARLLIETYGTKIDCWHFQKEDKDYLITLYFFKGSRVRSYVSFSISLVFSNES